MKPVFRLLAAFCLMALPLAAAPSFIESLSPEQKKRLGLDQLTPAQQAELGAAIEQYRKTGEVAAAQQAAQQAAATAVAEYKKKEEPGVVTRALEVFRRKTEEAKQERITGVLTDKFYGWTGRTLFRLDNGQVWRQSQPDTYSTKAAENVPVVIYKGPSGYWRLRVLDDEGAWVTVQRVQ